MVCVEFFGGPWNRHVRKNIDPSTDFKDKINVNQGYGIYQQYIFETKIEIQEDTWVIYIIDKLTRPTQNIFDM